MTFKDLKNFIGENRDDYKIVLKTVKDGISAYKIDDDNKTIDIYVAYSTNPSLY